MQLHFSPQTGHVRNDVLLQGERSPCQRIKFTSVQRDQPGLTVWPVEGKGTKGRPSGRVSAWRGRGWWCPCAAPSVELPERQEPDLVLPQDQLLLQLGDRPQAGSRESTGQGRCHSSVKIWGPAWSPALSGEAGGLSRTPRDHTRFGTRPVLSHGQAFSVLPTVLC